MQSKKREGNFGLAVGAVMGLSLLAGCAGAAASWFAADVFLDAPPAGEADLRLPYAGLGFGLAMMVTMVGSMSLFNRIAGTRN